MLLAGIPSAASASQSGLTGLPWVDQYIEQVPTAGGGEISRDAHGRFRTGLTRSEVNALADAGGDRMAAAIAASVSPLAGGNGPGGSAGTKAGSSAKTAELRRRAESVEIPSASATLIDTAGGGNGGLGPVLPAALIGSLIGAVALGASRIRRIGS